MFRKMTQTRGARIASALAVLGGLIFAGGKSSAQVIPCPIPVPPWVLKPSFPNDSIAAICNQYTALYVGAGNNWAGTIGIFTAGANPYDPGLDPIMTFGPIQPKDNPPYYTPYYGGWLYVRVNGGKTNVANGGADYFFGDPKNGVWTASPQQVGNHLEARWQNNPTAATGTTTTAVPQIEIDLNASFIHDTVRFAFTVKNLGTSQATVGLAFVEDINVQTTLFGGLDGPLRLPSAPYLRHETVLRGADIPAYYETYVPIAAATSTTPAQFHSIRATLKPTFGSGSEPTPPTRLAYGRSSLLLGTHILNGTKFRDFEYTWNFDTLIDPTIIFDKNVSAADTDAATCVYWDEEPVGPGAALTKITYLGGADASTDYANPLALSVNGPPALGFFTDRTNPANPVASPTPNPFTISAFVQNLTDLNANGQQITIGPINVFIDLPPGLKLAAGDTATKQIANVNPGFEGMASWSVTVDPANPHSGNLTYTVTAAPNVGGGKSVQRTIQVPAPATATLRSNKLTGGLFDMFSLPFTANNATPSQLFNLPVNPPVSPTNPGVSPQVDLLQWDPAAKLYKSVNTFIPGYAYWIRYNPVDPTISTKTFPINAVQYPPVSNQILPSSTSLPVFYPTGWNQIGDPYVYTFRFSELQVYNQDTLELEDVVTAADPGHNWILPSVYYYDSSDPDPTNWHYVLEDNFGFDMQPGAGYWLNVQLPNLRFIYPGADTPGGSVSRAALTSVGLGSALGRKTVTNWRLHLTARSAKTQDTLAYIGVAPKATDQHDIYKYPKPPAMTGQLTLDIYHVDWNKNNGRYAQDLRAPGAQAKTWDMVVTSPKPNENVTVSWPDIASAVPKNYQLTLVDTNTGARQDLHSTASYTLNTGPSATHTFQVIAELRAPGRPVITSFDIVPGTTRAAGTNAPNSLTIHYGLSATAETRITIRDGSGHTIRVLVPTTRSSGNGPVSGDSVWDMRNNKGAVVSTGVYNIEIEALDIDGHHVRRIKPYLLTR